MRERNKVTRELDNAYVRFHARELRLKWDKRAAQRKRKEEDTSRRDEMAASVRRVKALSAELARAKSQHKAQCSALAADSDAALSLVQHHRDVATRVKRDLKNLALRYRRAVVHKAVERGRLHQLRSSQTAALATGSCGRRSMHLRHFVIAL